MNALILNRDFQHPSDGWYMIEPRGEHPNRAAGVVQVIDEMAAASIVNRFNADAERSALSHGREMLIDHEHFKHDVEKETRAYGWLTKLENRADGIYGQVRWTTTGKAAVDGGDYRFFSTEYDPRDLKILNGGAPKRIRPLRLDGLTLTNNPNNRGGRPITNREKEFRSGTVPAADEPTNKRTTMKSVCTRLGLSADASEDAVLAEVNKLFNRIDEAKPIGEEVTKLKNRVTALEGENQTLLGEQVDALLDAHGVKEEKVRNRIKPMLVPLKNRAERVEALTDLGHKPLDPKAGKSGTVILNRGEGRNPAPRQEEAGDMEANAREAQTLIDEYKLTNRCTTEHATNTIRNKHPKLFGIAG